MSFKLIISPLAEVDLVEAYAYYADISIEVLTNFDNEIEQAYDILEQNPFFRIRYKNVEIRSVFNTHQDTERYR